MIRKSSRARLLLSAAFGALAFGSGVAHAQGAEPISIAAQPLASALYE
ncbi:MAG TPA: hypothetical protein VF122_02785 [Caulobacteraceae bacterium]